MALRGRLSLLFVWLMSLVIVGVVASAQTRHVQGGDVITGNDIGFRPEGWRGNARTGTLVVRIDGKWVDTADTATMHPAAKP